MKLYTRILSRIHPFTLGTVKDENLSKKIFLKLMKIAWKVLTLLDDNPIIVTYLLHGKSFYINAKHALPKMKLKWPYYDTSLTEIARFIECNLGYVTAIDIGANIGTTAISLSRSVGESGKVFAFEPQQIISQCLSANVLLNNIKNIEVYTLAVSSKSGWVYLDTDELSTKGRYGSVSVADKGHLVKSINLNEFKIKECSFIKIDVEGHEWEVIQGMKKSIEKNRPIIAFEGKLEYKDSIISFLESNGYSKFLVPSNYWIDNIITSHNLFLVGLRYLIRKISFNYTYRLVNLDRSLKKEYNLILAINQKSKFNLK